MIKRALIIKKEWLDRIFDCRIFDGRKTWEMRSTKTNVRGKIGLIEARSGLIVGEADLVGCGKRLTEQTAADNFKFHRVSDLSKLKYWCYPWILENAIRYEKPIPYNHPLGAVIWVNINESIFESK